MKRILHWFTILVLSLFALSSCGKSHNSEDENTVLTNKLREIASNYILDHHPEYKNTVHGEFVVGSMQDVWIVGFVEPQLNHEKLERVGGSGLTLRISKDKLEVLSAKRSQ